MSDSGSREPNIDLRAPTPHLVRSIEDAITIGVIGAGYTGSNGHAYSTPAVAIELESPAHRTKDGHISSQTSDKNHGLVVIVTAKPMAVCMYFERKESCRSHTFSDPWDHIDLNNPSKPTSRYYGPMLVFNHDQSAAYTQLALTLTKYASINLHLRRAWRLMDVIENSAKVII